MIFSDLSSLGNSNTKKIGLVVAFAFLIVEVAIKIKGIVDEKVINPIHLFFLMSLFWAVFSKEKIDDERLRAIRYFTFKTVTQLFIIAVALDLIQNYRIEPIYFATGTLVGYLIIYYFCVLVNPEFIFVERTRRNRSNLMQILMALMLIAVAIGSFTQILRM